MPAGHAAPACRSHGFRCSRSLVLPGLVAFVIHAGVSSAALPQKLDFNRQIRPLLSENCFRCHGADEKQRKGKLRLDLRDEAIAKKAILPGKPEESELVKRLFTSDEEDVMPPPKENHKLT